MNYWLLKTEPSSYSWKKMEKDKTAKWDGIHNFQALKFMRQMKKSDLAFFYHTGDEKSVVGVVEIIREFYPDPKDDSGKFGMVDVKVSESLKNPVSLSFIKKEPKLLNLLLIKQPRLSVIPLNKEEWETIVRASK